MEKEKTVLSEAEALVYGGDRNQNYGHPRESCQRIAGLWSAYLTGKYPETRGLTLGPDDVALMMLLLKVSRETGKHQRDNDIDMAGYVGVHARVVGEDE